MQQVRVGVDDLRDVATLRTFSPIEHAAADVIRIALSGEITPMLLGSDALLSAALATDSHPEQLPIADRVLREQSRLLLRTELDVTYPKAHRCLRNPKLI